MPDAGHWLDGRSAVVTGASRGIGRATAVAIANAGARVVLAARDADALDETCRAISDAGGEAVAIPTDVSRPADIRRLFAAAAEAGGPDALVCGAGALERLPFDETDDSVWGRTLAVNLTGVFLCCRAAFGAMKRAGQGRIVNIASLSGVYATEKFPGLAAYNASKFGVVGLTEAIAVEGRPHGISAICLSPGAVDTEMLRQAHPDMRAGLGADAVARLIVTLLDDPMTPASGANIPLFSNG